MKKMSLIVAAFALMIWIAAPAGACDGPDCSNVWVGGENILDQDHSVTRTEFDLGGYQGTGGYQGLNMWGEVHAPGQVGEYQALGVQAEGADFTLDIPGGQIQTGHLATQLGEIDISGGRAGASIWGENNFSVGTEAGAGVHEDGNSIDYTQFSANRNALDMAGEVCLWGDGTASYTSEALTQTGHEQSLDLPGGTAFTESLSQQRGFIEINKSN